jgi:Fructose-2,6-bisphosphatase
MNTELYFVRHGETLWNKSGRFQGCTDIPLSEQGIYQANRLREKLSNQFDCLYTSPLSRALQTAEIICKNTAMQPIILEDIREINFGPWEGLTLKQIEEQYPSEFQTWRADEELACLMGGDLTIKNASIRAKNAILDAVEKHMGERIIIVAHGGIMKAGLIGLFDWKMTMYHQLLLGNTCICKLLFNSKLHPSIITLNDQSSYH